MLLNKSHTLHIINIYQNSIKKSKGRKRRLGFGKRGKTSFTVQRSEEVLPGEMRGGLSRGSSASSDGEGSEMGDRFAKIHSSSYFLYTNCSVFIVRHLFVFLLYYFHYFNYIDYILL